jgi:hypothetical protein
MQLVAVGVTTYGRICGLAFPRSWVLAVVHVEGP